MKQIKYKKLYIHVLALICYIPLCIPIYIYTYMLDTNVFRYHQLNIIVTNAPTTCFQGPRLILNEPKYKLMNIHNKIEQWLRLRTRLVPLVVERHVAQFGKTITYKFYRQNKYAGRFITENVCAQPGVTLFFCNCNIM